MEFNKKYNVKEIDGKLHFEYVQTLIVDKDTNNFDIRTSLQHHGIEYFPLSNINDKKTEKIVETKPYEEIQYEYTPIEIFVMKFGYSMDSIIGQSLVMCIENLMNPIFKIDDVIKVIDDEKYLKEFKIASEYIGLNDYVDIYLTDDSMIEWLVIKVSELTSLDDLIPTNNDWEDNNSSGFENLSSDIISDPNLIEALNKNKDDLGNLDFK